MRIGKEEARSKERLRLLEQHRFVWTLTRMSPGHWTRAMDGRETATVKRARFTAYFHAGVAQDITSTVKVKKRVVAGSNSARTSPQNHINFQRAR